MYGVRYLSNDLEKLYTKLSIQDPPLRKHSFDFVNFQESHYHYIVETYYKKLVLISKNYTFTT